MSAEEKYDLWVRLLTGQVTQAQAAAEAGVDRTTIAKLRKVAKDGAIAALQAARPGRPRASAAEQSDSPTDPLGYRGGTVPVGDPPTG